MIRSNEPTRGFPADGILTGRTSDERYVNRRVRRLSWRVRFLRWLGF